MVIGAGSAGGCSADTRRALGILACCVWLAGCTEPAKPVALPRAEAHASAAVVPSIERDAPLFDRVVNPESVFADRAQRALYRMLPSVTEDGLRTYAFQLNPQPGMDPARHFNLVTVTWAPAGRFVRSAATSPGLSGSGGPQGGFVDGFAQTADGAYDVRVSTGMLLPDKVEVPAFDVEQAAVNMIRLYQAQKSDK